MPLYRKFHAIAAKLAGNDLWLFCKGFIKKCPLKALEIEWF